jgi:hypothetical protein
MTPRNLATCLAPTLFFPSQSYGGRAAAMTSIGHAINLIDVSWNAILDEKYQVLIEASVR